VLQAPLQRPRDQHRHPQHDAEIKHALEHAQQRQPQIADLDGQPIQEDQGRIEQVENRQHGDAVGGDHHRPRPHRLAHQHRKRADGDPGCQQVDGDPDPVAGPAEAHGDGTGDRQPGDPQQRKQQRRQHQQGVATVFVGRPGLDALAQSRMDEIVDPPGGEAGADQGRHLHGGINDVFRGKKALAQPSPDQAQPSDDEAAIERSRLHDTSLAAASDRWRRFCWPTIPPCARSQPMPFNTFFVDKLG